MTTSVVTVDQEEELPIIVPKIDDDEDSTTKDVPLSDDDDDVKEVTEAVAAAAAAAAGVEHLDPTAATDDGGIEGAPDVGAVATAATTTCTVVGGKKKRLCRFLGCTKVIKSQGMCQRHGAKAKRCKVEGCDKQAQGTHDGMCKRHWKAINFPQTQTTKPIAAPPPPEGESVYDGVLPQSISYRPSLLHKQVADSAASGKSSSEDPPPPPGGVSVMPLVAYLREGTTSKEPGWHRNAERRARGFFPAQSLSSQLEPWERQLALVEILLLSGGTPYANFKDLAYAWGREKGFHHVLASNICERRGEVERKRRSDAGKSLTAEQKESFRQKLKRTRTNNAASGVLMSSEHLAAGTPTMEVADGTLTINGHVTSI